MSLKMATLFPVLSVHFNLCTKPAHASESQNLPAIEILEVFCLFETPERPQFFGDFYENKKRNMIYDIMAEMCGGWIDALNFCCGTK